jgi:hypothetical protein
MNKESVYINPPKEVMLTIRDFHECSYYDKAVQFCNYNLIVDISEPRVIQLWTREGNSEVLAEKIPFSKKCYVSSSIEAEFVRIVKSPITLDWVNKHFGYAILKESEEELQKIWPELVDQETRKTKKNFYKESKHYIDFDKLLDAREAKWEEESKNWANKSFKKNIELIWNPDIMRDRLGYATFKGYYLTEEGILNRHEYIYLIWDTGREDRGYAEGFSKTGSSTGSHSYENLDKYNKLTREQFLEKFLEINEYDRLKEKEREQ